MSLNVMSKIFGHGIIFELNMNLEIYMYCEIYMNWEIVE